MRRRAFTLLSYLVALFVLLIMLAPEAEARFEEMTTIYRVTGLMKAAAEAAVSITPVPEPSRALLMLLGLVAMLSKRRR